MRPSRRRSRWRSVGAVLAVVETMRRGSGIALREWWRREQSVGGVSEVSRMTKTSGPRDSGRMKSQAMGAITVCALHTTLSVRTITRRPLAVR